MSKRLTHELLHNAATDEVRVEGATVVGSEPNAVTLDLLGVTVTGVPYVGTGWAPSIGDVVSVLITV